MSKIGGFKKMNWFPKQSAWNEQLSARAKRREMVTRFREDAAQLAGAFTNAMNNQIGNVGEIAARQAQARLQNEAKARMAEMQKQYERFNKLV